jgi:hypothetical protein
LRCCGCIRKVWFLVELLHVKVTYLSVVVLIHEASVTVEAVAGPSVVIGMHMVLCIFMVFEELPAAFTLPMTKGISMLVCGVVADKVAVAGVTVKLVGHWGSGFSSIRPQMIVYGCLFPLEKRREGCFFF